MIMRNDYEADRPLHESSRLEVETDDRRRGGVGAEVDSPPVEEVKKSLQCLFPFGGGRVILPIGRELVQDSSDE